MLPVQTRHDATGSTPETNSAGSTTDRRSTRAKTAADGRGRGFHFPLGLHALKGVFENEMGITIFEGHFGGTQQRQILHARG